MCSMSANVESLCLSLCDTDSNDGNRESNESIVEDCNECIEYMLDLVSLSLTNDTNTSDDNYYDSKRSQHCLISDSDDEVMTECKDLVDYMLELVSTAVPLGSTKTGVKDSSGIERSDETDDEIEIIECEKPNEESNCEVIDLTDSQSDAIESRDYCLICGQNKEMKYQVKLNGKIHSSCSWECVQTLKTSDCCHNCSALIARGIQAFRANFGGNVTLCSEECLLKSEVEQQPNTHCFTCRNPLVKDKVIFYWQTMEFCSAQCVQSRQLVFGSKCAQCQTAVNRQSLGKYSVRFGDIIKQFCVGTCLEAFKKSLKVCAFCQKDLKFCVTICIATFGFGEKMRLREFCDQICKAQYGLMLNARNAAQNQCAQCRRLVDSKSVIEFTYQNKKYSLCSSTCVAAFKHNYKLKTIFCENCHKYGWTNTSSRASLHILHFSGTTRVFCTKKCMSMYVLKNRKIVACLCCKVKKYNFDLIERFDWSQNDSRLFCSLNCLSLYEVAEQEKQKLMPYINSKVVCNQCNNYSIPQFFLKVEQMVRNFCSYQCVFQHQRQYLPDSLMASETNSTHMNGSVGDADNCVSLNAPLLQNTSTMWTPSFYGQQRAQTPQAIHLSQVRPNILAQRRGVQVNSPLSTVNKTLSSALTPVTTNTNSLSVSASNLTEVATTQSTGASTSTQTLIKEIVKETKEVIVKVPAPKVVKNKCTLFRPPSQTKATSCRPFQKSVEVQTDPQPKIICPILLPIPVFVPIPISYMQPLAVPLPLPIPFFFKPDPPPPPKPDPPKGVNGQNASFSSDNLNLTEQQFGEIQDLLADSEAIETTTTVNSIVDSNNASQQSSAKRRGQTDSEATSSKRGRRQSEATPRGRGGRGRGRGGRGGRGRGRGAAKRKKREEWEMSSSEEEEEEVPLDNDSEFEDYEQQNESSTNSEDVLQTPEQLFEQQQQQLQHDLQQQFSAFETNVETPVVSSGRGRGRGRRAEPTPKIETNINTSNVSVEEPKKGKRGRRKKEAEDPNVDNNSGIESQFSTNTSNAGINALRIWLRQSPLYYQTKNILELHQNFLSEIFCKFVEEVCQVHGQEYSPDYIYMLCLDLQKHLAENNRLDNIFMDPSYKQFIHAIHTRLVNYNPQLTCIQEEHLWECGQLGAHSPTVLLNTVMYLSTKFFGMTQIEEHTQFSFSNLSKEWVNESSQCLIYQSAAKRGRRRRSLTLYENVENQLRCPVKLFEFYLSKCPEAVIQRRDMFYLYPIEGCVPDSQTWYSCNPLTNASVTKMLQRILVVREIVAISSAPNL